MKLFSVASLKPILQLCTKWKPPGLKPDELESDDDKAEIEAHVKQVRESSRDFLVALFTSHKLGIVFYDPTAGTSGQNQNHLLQVGTYDLKKLQVSKLNFRLIVFYICTIFLKASGGLYCIHKPY